jgi:hypothetical protein
MVSCARKQNVRRVTVVQETERGVLCARKKRSYVTVAECCVREKEGSCVTVAECRVREKEGSRVTAVQETERGPLC